MSLLVAEWESFIMNECVKTAKTLEEAIKAACQTLNCTKEQVEINILAQPKKGFFGIGSVLAKVRVKKIEKETFFKENTLKKEDKPTNIKTNSPKIDSLKTTDAPIENEKAKMVINFITNIVNHMGVDAQINTTLHKDTLTIKLEGKDLGLLIGRRGETLDSLQYLAGLVINKVEGNYLKVIIDCGNYREKREKALEELAQKVSNTVIKSGKSITLEPMNPYERRIIHATASKIEGIISTSVGDEPYRKVVINVGTRRAHFSNNNINTKNQPSISNEKSLDKKEQEHALYSKIEV